MNTSIIIESKFRGPPDSGNGGYISGAFARHLVSPDDGVNDAVQVTLRAPTPLDEPLQVITIDEKHLDVKNGDLLIAQVERAELSMNVPKPPEYDVAAAAVNGSPSLKPGLNSVVPGGLGFHPICFCCGADVDATEGLRIFAAPVQGFDGVAAAWQPDPCFADEDGFLPSEIIWAALDCPGQFAFMKEGIRTGLLGRMTAEMLLPVAAAERIVIIGWCIAVEGKKHFAGTAMFNQQGECCAMSKQVWIGRQD
jgi:hypothetical protein|tara:strand:+ start:1178 stop:1933 length:756 start_codon:yes stop_codon:yes gene_type:complete